MRRPWRAWAWRAGCRAAICGVALTATGVAAASPKRPHDCFSAPRACGFPDPAAHDVGARSACRSLRSVGSVTATRPGQTVENLSIHGTLTIQAPNVRVRNVCVTESGNEGSYAVMIDRDAAGLRLRRSTFEGSAASGHGVIDTGVMNAENLASVRAKAILITNAAEDWHGGGTVTNSYMQAGATYDAGGPDASHNEDVYLNDASITLVHDTLLNSASQTAVLFGDNNGGSKGRPGDNHWVVRNSLLAGGGFLAYFNAGSTGVGSSTMVVSGNRIARCASASRFDGWGHRCAGGPDRYGYFPQGGYYGLLSVPYCRGPGQTWSENVWDDDNARVPC